MASLTMNTGNGGKNKYFHLNIRKKVPKPLLTHSTNNNQ